MAGSLSAQHCWYWPGQRSGSLRTPAFPSQALLFPKPAPQTCRPWQTSPLGTCPGPSSQVQTLPPASSARAHSWPWPGFLGGGLCHQLCPDSPAQGRCLFCLAQRGQAFHWYPWCSDPRGPSQLPQACPQGVGEAQGFCSPAGGPFPLPCSKLGPPASAPAQGVPLKTGSRGAPAGDHACVWGGGGGHGRLTGTLLGKSPRRKRP